MKTQPCEIQRQTGRLPSDDKAGIGEERLQVKEYQRLPTNQQRLGRGKERFPCRLQRAYDPADSFMLDF